MSAMRVACYRVLYGEDFIQESIRAILPYVDRVVVALAPRPWGTSTGVTYKGEWVPWPEKFDDTREKIAALNEPHVLVIDDFWPTPANQHQHIVNDLVLPRFAATEVIFIEPDHVFAKRDAFKAFVEWGRCPAPQATTRMIELWRTPQWRIAERHRPSVIFQRINGPIGPTSGDGGRQGVSSTWLHSEVHNLGFCFSDRVMKWKHLSAIAFSPEIHDAPPDVDWLDRWRSWHPTENNKDLEISLGGQHTITHAFPYTPPGDLPESILQWKRPC